MDTTDPTLVSFRGAAAIMQVPLQGDWTLEQVLQGGHTDIVRSCRLDLQSGSAVTCGEDGQVCLWSASSTTTANGASAVRNDTSQSGIALKVRCITTEKTRFRRLRPLFMQASNERESKSSRYAPY